MAITGESDSSIDFNSHAHVERDTKATAYLKSANNFNSHAHVERDRRRHLTQQDLAISTHTLTWSVTRADTVKFGFCANFNSHAHVERD